MERSLLLLITWLLVTLPGLLVGQELQWVRQIGGTGYIDTKNSVIDSEGNTYTIGSFQGTIDFDPSPATQTLTSGSDIDVFVAKYAANGDLIFVNQINVSNDEGDVTYAEDITFDASSNIFISVSFQGDVTLGNTTLSSTPQQNGGDSRDILLARYNADGSLSFAHRLGSSGTEYGYALATTSDNKIVFVGRFQDEVDFDPGAGETILQSGDNTDIFMTRYNTNGSLEAAIAIGGEDYQAANNLVIDASNNIIIAGSYGSRISLDPTSNAGDLSNPGTRNGFVAKYDQNFNFQFAAPLLLPQNTTGEPLEMSFFVQTDFANNILVTGRFLAEVIISGQRLTASGNGTDIYLAKYQPNGSLVFARTYGGSGFEESRDATTDQDNNIYIVGNFQGTLDLDAAATDDNISSTGGNDGFLAKLSPSGDYINVQAIQGSGDVLLKRLTRHPSAPQTLIMAGIFTQNIILTEEVSLTSQGDYDFFLARYDLSQPPVPGDPVSLATLSVYEGTPGTTVTLFGENFSTILEENSVQFGTTDVDLVNVNNTGTELTVIVPESLAPGSYEVTVTVGGNSDAADQVFTVLEGTVLTLDSLSDNAGRPGDMITLNGSGFTPESVVTFGGEAVAAGSVNGTGTAITITVPEREPGDYEVTVTVGEETTAPLTFRINAPGMLNLQSLSIYVGQVGDELVLRGVNFGETIEDNAVAFADSMAEVISMNEERTELTVRVPNVAIGSYIVSLSVDGQSDTADRPFLVDTYCASSAQEDVGIRIEQVDLDQTNYISDGGCAAYTNFTDQPTLLGVGSTVSLRVTVGTCSEDESKAVRVFADWNGDLDFEDEGETVATSAPLAGATTFETEISVPEDAPVDLVTRLRIVLSSVNETVPPANISPCGVYARGETQDFQIQLVASPSPLITALSPTVLEANVPGVLVISGENFGDVVDSITVMLGDTLISATDVQVNGAGTQITVITPPLAAGEYGVQVTVGDQTVTAAGVITVTSEVAQDEESPEIVLSAPGLLNEEVVTFAVSGEVVDASGVGNVTLEFLPIRKNPDSDDWRKLSASREGTTNTYIAQLTETDLDELGVQTRIIASDVVGNTDTSAIQYTFRNYTAEQPLGLSGLQATGEEPSANDYNLVAIPLQGQTVRQAFSPLGEYDTRRWRAWQLGEEGAYQEYSRGWGGEMQAGRGYMLIYTAEGAMFQSTGRVVEATYDQPFTLTLEPGFTLIGNPYPFALDWSQVLAYNELEGENLTLKTFDEGFREASRLEAFQGGLVTNPNEGQVIELFLPVGTVSSVSGRSGQIAEPQSSADWQLTLSLRSEELSTQGVVGMHSEAQVGVDGYDDFAVPRLADFPQLISEHEEFFLPALSRDMVGRASHHAWEWQVVGQAHEVLTLHWDAEEVQGLDGGLWLVDEGGVRQVDMRAEGQYRVQTDGEGRYALKVVYGAGAEVLDGSVQVGLVYPNPMREEMRVPVKVGSGEKSRMMLEVVDVTGRVVDEQVYEDLSPGYHTLTWKRNATHNTNSIIPSGVYLLRMRFENEGWISSQRIVLQ